MGVYASVVLKQGECENALLNLVNAAMPSCFSLADMAAYRVLETLYKETPHEQQAVAQARYNVWVAHPIHHILDFTPRAHRLGLEDSYGYTEADTAILRFVDLAGWDYNAIPLIKGIRWG